MNSEIFNIILEKTSEELRPKLKERIINGMYYDDALLILEAYELYDKINDNSLDKNMIPFMQRTELIDLLDSLYEKDSRKKKSR